MAGLRWSGLRAIEAKGRTNKRAQRLLNPAVWSAKKNRRSAWAAAVWLKTVSPYYMALGRRTNFNQRGIFSDSHILGAYCRNRQMADRRP
jgi:hypothetical protein